MKKDLKLVWDSHQFKVHINQINIYIAPEDCSPFPVKAIVEEQDTSLVLEPADEIHEYNDTRPLWYLSNTRELQKGYQAGEVIVKSFNPMRFLAIVHDLDCDPTWSTDWIKAAIENVFGLCCDKELVSLALPVLGSQFGKIDNETFLKLLVKQLQHKQSDFPEQIWLIVPAHQCQRVYDCLNESITHRYC
ncbi:MAG: hypothetical protein KAI17_25540 [Thiotrichaceae bacterium]|nr:hypothetical protein [Thiotrichaceae bacterium]